MRVTEGLRNTLHAKAKGSRAFMGWGKGSSSHTRYYRTQPGGHKYIIYDVIYVLEILRALSKILQHPPNLHRPAGVFLTYSPSLWLSWLNMCYVLYELATTLWKSNLTYQEGGYLLEEAWRKDV